MILDYAAAADSPKRNSQGQWCLLRILGELVLIKLWEHRSQPLLRLAGERHAPVLPVDGDKLGKFVGTLDDAGKLFLCHAKPRDAAQAGVSKELIWGRLNAPDTWEVALSSVGASGAHSRC